MLQWNALDNTLTLFISVWIAVQWLPEGATWVPLPNLCHQAEDFNCQASSSALPMPLSVFSFWLTISLFRLVSFIVLPPLCHYSKCQCHFWVFYHFFLFWFFGFSLVLGCWSLNSELWQLLIVCLPHCAEQHWRPPLADSSRVQGFRIDKLSAYLCVDCQSANYLTPPLESQTFKVPCSILR